jgi:hypothetical protein
LLTYFACLLDIADSSPELAAELPSLGCDGTRVKPGGILIFFDDSAS